MDKANYMENFKNNNLFIIINLGYVYFLSTGYKVLVKGKNRSSRAFIIYYGFGSNSSTLGKSVY
jgi:hypothetical protein